MDKKRKKDIKITLKTIAVLGLGNRGTAYSKRFVKSDVIKIVGVCDVNEKSLLQAKELYDVPENALYHDENVFFEKKRADVLIISTLDKLHFHQTMRALELGYDILLEKPVAPDYEECRKIAEYSKKLGRKVVVCHNLRYTPFYQTIKRVVSEGKIGEVISFEQSENVGYGHYMCSFVRGKWHNYAEASPIILQKCCHDLDIIYWIIGKKCEKLTSFGSLNYYCVANAPHDSAEFCCDCPRKTCPYNSTVFFLESPESLCVPYGFDYSEESIKRYVSDKSHNYGRCVFRMENDVCDRQTVNMVFENGATANLLMHGFAHSTHRITRIIGTDGELEGKLEDGVVTVRKYGAATEKIDVNGQINTLAHSGGDDKLVQDAISYFVDGKRALGISLVGDSVYSHKLAFAAEKSRLNDGRAEYVGGEL